MDWSHFNVREFEFWGKINLLKAGIMYADVVNTVSPTYAREIQTPEFGQGLDGVLRDRHDVVHGVVNGIDDAVWNPAADPNLPADFGPEDLRGKASCKAALQRQAGLPQRKVAADRDRRRASPSRKGWTWSRRRCRRCSTAGRSNASSSARATARSNCCSKAWPSSSRTACACS